MAKKYVANLTIKTACGLPLRAGDTFDADEVEIGCLQSMLRLRQCAEYVEPKPEPAKPVESVKPVESAEPKSDDKKPEDKKTEPPKVGPAKPPTLRGG